MARDLASSIANPFNTAACVPDGARGVGCFSTKETFVLSTGAGGSTVSLMLKPDPYNSFFYDSATTAATPTVPNATFVANWGQATSYATINAQYEKWRPTSMGVRVSYTGATQTDGGTIFVGQVPANIAPTSFNGKALSQAMNLCSYYETYPLRNGAFVTWRPQEMTDIAQWFRDANVTLATVADQPFLVVIVYGASASQTLVTCECITNYEGTYFNQNYIAAGADLQAKPAEPGWYEKAVNIVRFVKPISPLIGFAADRLTGLPISAALSTLSNGLPAPGMLSKSKALR